MTVAELIAELQKLPQTAVVGVYPRRVQSMLFMELSEVVFEADGEDGRAVLGPAR